MDVRQQRTRDRLHATVLELAEARPISEITMTELTTAAKVHRSTLYEHATSPFALLEDALTGELDRLRSGLSDGTAVDAAVTEVTRGVLDHVLAHRDIYRRGLGEASGAASLHPMLARHFRTSGALLFADHDWGALVADGVTTSALTDAATRFLADGTVGQIAGWIEESDPDVDQFLRVYLALVPPWWPGQR